jgi:hypothetical protein
MNGNQASKRCEQDVKKYNGPDFFMNPFTGENLLEEIN